MDAAFKPTAITFDKMRDASLFQKLWQVPFVTTFIKTQSTVRGRLLWARAILTFFKTAELLFGTGFMVIMKLIGRSKSSTQPGPRYANIREPFVIPIHLASG